VGTLRFLWKRFVAQRMLGLAVVVTLAFSVGVLVAGPIYADAAREAILSSSLTTADVTVVNTRFILPGGPDFDLAAADAEIRQATSALPVREVVAQGRGPIVLGPEGADPSSATSAIFREGAEEHLPDFKGEAPGNREVAIPATLARSFGVRIGDSILAAGASGRPTGLTVSATFSSPAAGDPFWFGDRSPFPAPDSTEPAPVLLGRDGYLEVARDLGISSEFVWDAYLDIPAVSFDEAERLPGEIEATAQRLRDDFGLTNLRVGNGLDTLLEVVRQRISNLRVPILLVVFQIGAVTLAVLAGVGSLTLTRQAFELAVLHSRGFSRRTLLLAQAVQAVLAAVVAYPLGLLLGLGLAKLASSSNGETLPGTLFPVGLTPAAELLGLCTAVLGAAILLVLSIPHVRRTVLEQRRSLSREDRPPLARLPVELFLAPVGVFAFLQLRGQGTPTPGAGTIDPLVLLAPTLLIFAASFFALRLLLWTLRALDRVIGRSRGVPRYLAFRRLGRAPGIGFAAALLLLLSMGLLVVSTSYRAIVLRSHEDSAHQQIGGDWSIQVSPPGQPLAVIAHMPAATTPIVRTEPRFESGSFSLSPVALGIDPASYDQGGWWRDDYGDRPIDEILAALRTEPYGIDLPEAAEQLTVELDVPPELEGVRLAATAASSDGTVTTRQADRPLEAGSGSYTADLAGAARLLSVSLLNVDDVDLPFEFTLGVGSIAADGQALDLQGFEPMSWRGSSGVLEGSDLRVTRGSGEVVGGLVPRSDALPVLVSDAVAQSQGGESFSVTLGSQQFQVRRVATATTFPTVLPNGPFLVVSGPALLERAAAIPEPGLALNEVWADGDADPRPALREVGFVPGPARRTAPIIGALAQLPPSLAVGLQFTAAAAGLGLVIIGVAVGLSIAQRRRDFEFAALRAMGIEARHLRRTVVIEQTVLLGFAVVAGLAVGYAMLKLMLPYFGRDLGVSFPEPVLVVDAVTLAASVAAIAVATFLGLSLSMRSLLRSSVTGVLRGEAE
jgi:ABC-type lipoprotein release transport system permease subunit